MSLFDDAFGDVAGTFSDVFGDAGTWTVSATDTDVSVSLIIIEETNETETDGSTKWDVWRIRGQVLKSKVGEPAKGDLFKRTSNTDRVFKLTQTPTMSKDGSSWDVVVEHRKATQQGDMSVVPIFNG